MACEVPLRCNGCAGVLRPNGQAVASSCLHLFCMECAQKLVQADECCPICQTSMPRSTMKMIVLLQPASKCRLVLCGQTPQVVTDAALHAINFYVEQQRVNMVYDNTRLQARMATMERQCRKKLSEMQNAYQQAKLKCQHTMQQKNAIEQDNQELQQKYAQKAMQARKLQEMFKALQQENEELKRRLGMHHGGVLAAGSGSGGMLGAAGCGRHPSPFRSGPAQMVTTVRQTKSVIELRPTPGSLHMLTGHGSAVAGAGGSGGGGQQRPITPGGFAAAGGFFGGLSPNLGPSSSRGMAGAGHRPGTSGGMFAAAAAGLGGGRGGMAGSGVGGGGGGAMLRMGSRGLVGLGSPGGHGMMSL